jgi:hypothetical protein
MEQAGWRSRHSHWATRWTVPDLNPGGGESFLLPNRPDRFWGPPFLSPSSVLNSYLYFPAGKAAET